MAPGGGVVGIDFGTANLIATAFVDGQPRPIPATDGATSIPAVVSLAKGRVAVGSDAVALALSEPEATVRGVKRLLAAGPGDPVLARVTGGGHIEVETDDHQVVGLRLGGKRRTPDKLVSTLLAYVHHLAQQALGHAPSSIVLTAPPWFGRAQRSALEAAASAAWLPVLRTMPEPTAFAIGLGAGDGTIAIVDVGAGGTSASVVKVQGADVRLIASVGQGGVGGEDVDQTIAGALTEQLRHTGIDANAAATRETTRAYAEMMKRTLSTNLTAGHRVELAGLSADLVFDRAQLAPLFAPLIANLAAVIRRLLEANDSTGQAIDAVYLGGGLAHVPAIAECVERLLGMPPRPVVEGLIARGAALVAAALAGDVPPIELHDDDWTHAEAIAPVEAPPRSPTQPLQQPEEAPAMHPRYLTPQAPSYAAPPIGGSYAPPVPDPQTSPGYPTANTGSYGAPLPGPHQTSPGYPAPLPGAPQTNPGYPTPPTGYPMPLPGAPQSNPGYPTPPTGYPTPLPSPPQTNPGSLPQPTGGYPAPPPASPGYPTAQSGSYPSPSYPAPQSGSYPSPSYPAPQSGSYPSPTLGGPNPAPGYPTPPSGSYAPPPMPAAPGTLPGYPTPQSGYPTPASPSYPSPAAHQPAPGPGAPVIRAKSAQPAPSAFGTMRDPDAASADSTPSPLKTRTSTRPAASTTRARPSQAPSRPPKAAVAVPSRGRIENPCNIRGLAALKLVDGATSSDADLICGAALLLRIAAQRSTAGTLSMSCGKAQAQVRVSDGRLYFTPADEKAVVATLLQPSGVYYFEAEKPTVEGLAWTSPRRMVASALSKAAAKFETDEIVASFKSKLDHAPRIPEDKSAVVHGLGLDDRDQRTLRLMFDGRTSIRRMANGPKDTAKAALQLLVVLSAFDCVEWARIAKPAGTFSARKLEKLSLKMEAQNYFDVLEVHWSAPDNEVKQAYDKLMQQLRDGGDWHSTSPESVVRMRRAAEAAFKLLKDPDERAAYTKTTYADLDFQGIVDVISGTIDSHMFRGEEEKANETRTKLAGLRSTFRGKRRR